MIDQNWCWWFAGFVDGEGCFTIEKTHGDWYGPRFQVNQRVDDRQVIDGIHQTLGVGNVSICSLAARRSVGIKAADIAQFRVYGKNCVPVIAALDGKLATKKALEFELWKEAVQLHVSTRLSTKLARMKELRDALQEAKRYKEAL